MWMFVGHTKIKVKPTEEERNKITNLCRPIIEQFKKQYIQEKPDKRFNYLVDVYTKWNRNYFYFCEKFKSEYPERIADEFEIKFVRLEYTGKDSFNFSYFRHTWQWFLVANDLTLKDCIEMMQDNPNFHPAG